MDSILLPECSLSLVRLRATPTTSASPTAACNLSISCPLFRPLYSTSECSLSLTRLRRSFVVAANGTLTTNSASSRNVVYNVGEFMTTKDQLHVVKATTTVDEALEMLVENRITGFPVIDDNWNLTLNAVQTLLSKTNGQLVGDVMTPAPVVVCETTNLEDAASILLETKFRRLPVVDADGKLVGIITRGNVVRAALQMKRVTEGTE